MTTLLNAFAFALGAWYLQQQAALPSLSTAAAIIPIALLAWLVIRRRWPAARAISAITGLAVFAIAGFLWAAAVAHWKLSSQLPELWEGRDLRVVAVVAEMTYPGERVTRLVLDIEKTITPNAEVPPRIAVNWYEEMRAGSNADIPLRAGQRWTLTLRLRRPHANLNPHGFDSEAWMLEHGIRATGYVRREPGPVLVSESVWSATYAVERAREAIRGRLQTALTGRPYAGVITALAIGDQRSIPAHQWKVFTRTGVNHLMSISGLHITMVSSLVFALVLRLWRAWPRLALRLPALRAATGAGLVVAASYAALAGFAVPAQRTVFMLSVVAAALLSGWRWAPSAALGAALFVVVALDPMAPISAGFWLSFGAIAAIMLSVAGTGARVGWLRGWLRAQWAVTVALVPLLLALFQQVSIVSPFANAIAIPVVSLCVAPLALLGIVLPFDFIAISAHAIMAACMSLLEHLSQLPAVTWQQHAPPGWAIPLALAGAVWILLPRGFPARWAGTCLMLPLFLAPPPRPAAGELWLTLLDVGQGLAVVARTNNHALIFDAGPAYHEASDAGERIVVPYVRGEGIRALDAMVLSHDDLDHTGGASSVLAAIPVARLISSTPQRSGSGHAATPAERCESGQSWNWDGVRFEILHPNGNSYQVPRIKDNDRSCVLRMVSRFGSVLIPADIERRSERELLSSTASALQADVLVAPHHGSRTSSGEAFIAAVSPRLVLFAVGHRNPFGHPHPTVVARYYRNGVRALRSDISGAIILKFSASGIEVSTWRSLVPRYWHNQ